MRILHGLKPLAAAAACCLGLCACKPGVVYHAFRPVPATEWRQGDTLRFLLCLPDSTGTYALSVELRHLLNYPYTELPVGLTLATASDSILTCDTLHIPVTDNRGNHTGTGWGDLRVAASSPLIFSPGCNDTLRLTLLPALDDSLLPGVNDVGICIEKQ